MPQDTKVTRNITVDTNTDALVLEKKDELSAITGDDNYSAAIRAIVREWNAYRTIHSVRNVEAKAA